MNQPEPQLLFDGPAMSRMIGGIAGEIVSEFGTRMDELCMIGMQQRGVPFAERLAAEIRTRSGAAIPLGKLDITMYRDDIGMRKTLPVIRPTEIPFDINGKILVLADDVMEAGRTIRAALDALTDYGRPAIIRLAILIDRGKHEFPIAADYTGKNLHADSACRICVRWNEIDGSDSVRLEKHIQHGI